MRSSLLCALLLAASPARAWRETGHFTVCELAFRRLDPQAKKAVVDLLGERFAESCTWPDTVRKTPKWKHTYGWHFVNVEDGDAYPESADPKGDVVQALILMEDALRDPAASKEEKARALKFLGHFAGDVHQPLHVGRKSDLGGNNVKVSWFGETQYRYEEMLEGETLSKREPINLHKVWDLHLLERQIARAKLEDGTLYKHRAYADFLEKGASSEDSGSWQQATFLDWALESRALRAEAYEVGDGTLGEEYYQRAVTVANRRMLQAGVRLAGVLNRAFREVPLSAAELEMRGKFRR